MNRPKLTEEIKLEAARDATKNTEYNPIHVAECYRFGDDGYQLAKRLDEKHCYDSRMGDAEELDGMDAAVRRLMDAAEKKWAAENNIQPPYPNGTVIMEGVIDGVYEHGAAQYKVKAHGCEKQGRFLIIRFENAVLKPNA